MTVVPNLITIALDTNGLIAPGARMYWFAAGTETPATVYSDSDLITPHAHPIDADLAGVFPPVYADTGSYKVRVKLSAAAGGATLYEVDDLVVTAEGSELNFPTSVKTNNFSVTANDRGKVFLCDASGIGGLNLVITADSAGLGDGFPFFVVNNAATGTITVQGSGGQTIDGQASVTLGTQNESTGFVSKGATGWQRVMSSTSSTFTTAVSFAGPVVKTMTTLTDASTIAWNLSTGSDFQVTIAANRTLGAFTGGTVGQEGLFRVIQDATGGRTLDLSDPVYDFWGGLTENIAQGANDVTDYDFKVVSSGSMILKRRGATSIGGPGKDLLSTQSASSSATIDFVLTKWLQLYDRFELHFADVLVATDAVTLGLRTSTNGGSTYDAGGNDYNWLRTYADSSTPVNASDSDDTNIMLNDPTATEALSNVAGETASGTITLYNPRIAQRFKASWQMTFINASTNIAYAYGVGVRVAATDVDAVRLLASSGNITSGSFRLYGIRK